MEKHHMRLRAKDKKELEDLLRKGGLPVKCISGQPRFWSWTGARAMAQWRRQCVFVIRVFLPGARGIKKRVVGM
jgi:hypothetical protein